MELVSELLYWIRERHEIYLRKEAGFPPPWTKDPILQNYRFCNPYRENDKVTKWIRQEVYDDFKDDPNVWFISCICRLLNNPDSIPFCIGDSPYSWDADEWRDSLKERRSMGYKIFNAAYIVSTNGIAMDKIDYLADRVLTPLWQAKEYHMPKSTDTLYSFFDRLNGANGMGKFMSAQVVADLKYMEPLSQTVDWWTFAEPGPGSLRGMRRLHGLDVNNTCWDKHWYDNIWHLRDYVNDELSDMPEFHAQDIQNCLCEFDKYIRAKSGNGVPKQKYKGA